MKYLRSFVLAATVLLLANCTSSQSKNPVGMALDEDLSEKMNGRWAAGKDELQVHCKGDGTLEVAQIEWDEDAGKFKLVAFSGKVLKLNDDFYITNLKDDGGKTDSYFFALTSLEEENQAIYWIPNHDVVKELVMEGHLTGKIDNSDIVLEGDGGEIAKVLEEQGLEKSFDWQRPMVFWRKPGE